MAILKFTLLVLVTGLCSCKENTNNHKIEHTAVELNNSAMKLLPFIDNIDSSKKAISLLDSATAIDSNYFLGYHNKLIFYNHNKEFAKALLTIKDLVRIKPFAQDIYLTGGALYERIGDTISSKNYFQKSLTICDTVLDTMNTKNRDYELLVVNKAANLIMLGYQDEGNEILKKLSNSQPEDEGLKKFALSIMNKNKNQLVDFIINGQTTH